MSGAKGPEKGGNGGGGLKGRRLKDLQGWLSELPRSARWDCDDSQDGRNVDGKLHPRNCPDQHGGIATGNCTACYTPLLDQLGIAQISTVGLRLEAEIREDLERHSWAGPRAKPPAAESLAALQAATVTGCLLLPRASACGLSPGLRSPGPLGRRDGRQSATGAGQSTTDPGHSLTDPGESTTDPDIRRPTPDIRRLTPDSHRPTPDSRRPTPDNGRLTRDIQRLTAVSGRPTAVDRCPSADTRRSRGVKRRLSAVDRRLSGGDRRLSGIYRRSTREALGCPVSVEGSRPAEIVGGEGPGRAQPRGSTILRTIPQPGGLAGSGP
jgi:hypothetical protein